MLVGMVSVMKNNKYIGSYYYKVIQCIYKIM